MPDLIPDRPPTARELRAWEKVRSRILDFDRQVTANRLRMDNLAIVYRFAAAHKIALPMITSTDEQKLKALETNARKFKQIVRDVEDLKLGVRLRSDGDLDIMAPPWATKEALIEYRPVSLDGVFIVPIVLGVLVLAAIGALSMHLINENQRLTEKLAGVLRACDDRLCAVPGETCESWKVAKQAQGFEQNKSFIESLSEAAKPITHGIGLGAAIAIGILAWSWFGKKSEVRQ